MRSYGKIESGFWQNPKVRALSDDGKLLLAYIFSCPHGNSVGCFALPSGYIQADLGWSSDRVSERVSELVAKGFIERDEGSGLTRIRGWWGHNTIENANVAKAAVKSIRALPRCAVFDNLVDNLNTLRNKFLDPLLNELAKELASEFRDVSANASDNEYRNPNLTEPNLTEPEPEPEPEPTRASARATPEPRAYAFEGKVLRVNQRDFDQWRASFHTIADLHAELTAIDAKFADQGVPRKQAFGKASGWLSAKHERRLSERASTAAPADGEPYVTHAEKRQREEDELIRLAGKGHNPYGLSVAMIRKGAKDGRIGPEALEQLGFPELAPGFVNRWGPNGDGTPARDAPPAIGDPGEFPDIPETLRRAKGAQP